MTMADINLFAAAAAAIVSLGIGALWYSPVMFGRAWATANGYTREKLEFFKTNLGRIYLSSFIAYVATAVVLSILMVRLDMTSVGGGMAVGVMCWFGFVAAIGLTANMFSDRPLMAYAIDTGYQLVYLVSMGALLGLMR